MRVKLTLSYDGTNYSGWQVQPNGVKTVQEVLENALYEITGENIRVIGSGRTDAGVHAEGQVVHFERQKENIPPERFARALNTLLPPDIKVHSSERVADDFNARGSAKRKKYRYQFYISPTPRPLKERYFTQLEKQPDLQKMIKAKELFIGEHDFKAFCASGSEVKSTTRKIFDFEVEQTGMDLIFTVCGNGFLYNMVRIMVGTLLAVGQGRMTEEDIKRMLESGQRAYGVKTISAKGLFLERVDY